MALINCRECQQKVSSEAELCPHCGCPTPNPIAKLISQLIRTLFLLSLLLAFLWYRDLLPDVVTATLHDAYHQLSEILSTQINDYIKSFF
jgi:hypothetical protein